MIQRLHSRSDFTRLRREGTRVRRGAVWCIMLADPELDGPRVAFAIGRAAGNAVRRNRVRRQLRELIRPRSLAPGLYLFGLSQPAEDVAFSQFSTDIDAICQSLGVPA